MKCLICNNRPANESGFCHNCEAKIRKDTKARNGDKPFKYVTYKGHVVGMYPNGSGKYAPRLLNKKPESLPKSNTLDLNTYLEGFDRETIKRLKAAVLRLAHA